MNRTDCARAEVLAGAVALGEASDSERDAYRRHLSNCAGCIAGLGGELEIERVMETVAHARDGESWEPDITSALRERSRTKRHAWRFGLSAIAAATVISIGLHAIVAAGVTRIGLTPDNPIVLDYDGQHISLEHRPASHVRPPARVAAAPHNLVVVHNVVTLNAPAPHAAALVPVRVAAVAAAHGTTARAAKAHPALRPVTDPTTVAALGPSQRDERSIAALRTAETAPPAEQRAESIAVVPQSTLIRDVAPLGGENAIVPRPSAIAYEESAEGTTAIDVAIDERGIPQKCTITHPSGFLVLDEAVCRAAMHAHYTPKTINGRAVASIYHDAFTFRTHN